MDENTYVMGNVFFFLYHELGHALVDQAGLPMLGRHEDAVDAFAMAELITQLTHRDTDLESRERLTLYGYSSIDHWLKSAAEYGAPEADQYFGVHALDQQRFFRTACLAYGGSSDDFRDVAEVFGLLDYDLEGCRQRYFEAYDGWTFTLDTFNILEGSRPNNQDDLVFEFLPAERAQHARWQTMAENWIDLARIQRSFSNAFALENPVRVTFESCGQENAFYYPYENRVSICYEIMAAAARYHGRSTRAIVDRGLE